MLEFLADLGRTSVSSLWLPLAAWTAVALVAEATLRVVRPRAELALPLRGAVLTALPLAVVAPQVLRWIAPDATTAVAAVVPVPTVTWLPEVAVGSPAPAVEAVPAAMPVLPVLLGLAVVAAGTLTLVAFASLLRSLVAVRSVRRSLAPAGSEAHDAVADARQRLGIRRAVSVAQAPAGVAPFTVGWRRPLVALPADLSAEALDAAVLHEVAHVRRSDFAWHAAQRAVTAVFAAHPLAWVLGRGLDLDRERAADALVLASGTSPKTYADLLFSYATLPAPPLALGATHGSSALKSRIDAMTHRLSASQSRRLHQLGRLVGLVVLTAVVGGATLMSPTSSALQGENLGDPFAYVERLDVYRANVEPPEAFAYLRDDAPAGTAEAIVEALSDSEGDIRVTLYGPENATSFNSNPEALGPRRLGMGAVRVHSVGTRPVRGPERDMAPAPDLPDGADRTVEGLVLDADSRSPIAGISVAVTGTTVGAATGPDGRYQLNDVPAGDQRLRVSGPGYTMRVVALAADQTSLDIALTTRNAGPSGVVQTSPAGAPRPDVFEVAEVQPELIGGLAALQERVVYPSMAREAGIEGQVVVQFIVDEEGNVTDPVVLRSPADILSQAALEAVNASRFTPARQQGRAVKVRFAVPVTFRLPSGDGEDRGSRMERDNGPAIFYDVSYSNDLERFVDHSTSLATRSRASLMARVAAGDSPFRDLRPGTARLRFRVQDNGRMLILGDVEGDSDTLERFARFHALGTEFEPGAAGLEGEMVVSVTRVS